jgi:hypothetical protein
MILGILSLVTGCVQNPGSRTYGASGGFSDFAATLTSAAYSCSSEPNPKPKAVEIKVFFREFGTDEWCPYAVDNDCALVFENKHVTWQAYKEDGTVFPAGQGPKFELFFDPIQGQPIVAQNGKKQVNLDPNAPRVTYKYTVWRDASDNNDKECEPLDPNIRIY